jgi:hypothetical protein
MSKLSNPKRVDHRFGDMLGSALGAFLPAIEHGRQDFLEAGRLQALGEMPAISAYQGA